jgi:hypothetical protein
MRPNFVLGISFIMGLAFTLVPNIGMAASAPLYTGDNVLACANFNDGTGSSDMTLILQLDADGKMLVDEGAPVKFIVPQSDIANFQKQDFDDSAWQDGKSGVGFADSDDNTEVPSGISTIYTRYHFKVADATAVKKLVLRADYDDDYVAWLNGVEIARSPGMATGGSKEGDVPPWNYSAAGGTLQVSNHEASKANPPAWQQEVVVDFQAMTATSVRPAGKLATTWSEIKSKS